ncbi:MAG: UrcA family protein [Gammaproteobacteria bacterium]|nr:UrcA family protein [Gammaproteobacteria bacterium]MDE2261502.1 UrcA family protein [Gammaproteobacteria bacterium]
MRPTGTSLRAPLSALILTSLAAASLPFLTSPCQAAAPTTAEEPAAITVRFGDLNLHSRAGIDVLYQRIAAAARDVCGGDTNTRSLADWSQSRLCRQQSIARAVATVGIPELLAVYTQRNGRPIDRKILLTKR